MDYKKILAFAFMVCMLIPASMAATSIVTPADSAELTLGAGYNFTLTTGVTDPINCQWFYMHKGGSSNTSMGNNTADLNQTWLNTTVPDSWGTNQFSATCSNGSLTEHDSTTMSVTIKNYDAGELSEVTIDVIVTVAAFLVGMGSLIGLLFLYLWIKKKL
jgi:opacity protein-like surface antigen